MIIFEDDEDEKLCVPDNDGITHINTFSRGRTLLGRMLSNFYYSPFEHPQFGKFNSIEGFWYWYITGMTNDLLRELYGAAAKKEGSKYANEVGREYDEDFHSIVLDCIATKILSNPEIIHQIKESDSTLPFIHYYVYGDIDPKVYYVECKWMMDGLEEIRKFIKDE